MVLVLCSEARRAGHTALPRDAMLDHDLAPEMEEVLQPRIRVQSDATQRCNAGVPQLTLMPGKRKSTGQNSDLRELRCIEWFAGSGRFLR